MSKNYKYFVKIEIEEIQEQDGAPYKKDNYAVWVTSFADLPKALNELKHEALRKAVDWNENKH